MTPNENWDSLLHSFNTKIKPLFEDMLTEIDYLNDISEVERSLAAGFSNAQIAKKFLTLAVLVEGIQEERMHLP
jgi:hypothetical protein